MLRPTPPSKRPRVQVTIPRVFVDGAIHSSEDPPKQHLSYNAITNQQDANSSQNAPKPYPTKNRLPDFQVQSKYIPPDNEVEFLHNDLYALAWQSGSEHFNTPKMPILMNLELPIMTTKGFKTHH